MLFWWFFVPLTTLTFGSFLGRAWERSLKRKSTEALSDEVEFLRNVRARTASTAPSLRDTMFVFTTPEDFMNCENETKWDACPVQSTSTLWWLLIFGCVY